MHERSGVVMRTALCWMILIGALVTVIISTIPNGSRSLVASTVIATVVHFLFLLTTLVILAGKRLAGMLRSYPAIWIAVGSWLLISIFQSFGLLGFENHDRSLTLYELNLYFAYAGYLFLLMCVLDSYPKIRFVIAALLVLAVAQTAFGIYNYAIGQPPFGWKPPLHSGIRVSGSYLNRNLFATLIAMIIGLTLVPLLIRRADRSVRSSKSWSWPESFRTIVLILLTLFLMLGLILSESRGGLIAFAGALFAILAVSLSGSRCYPRWVSVSGLAIVFIIIGVLVYDKSRFIDLAGDSSARLMQWEVTLGLISDYWLIGYGPGAYETVYKTVVPTDAGPLVFDHAHNDYLELLLEQGVLGALPLSILMFLTVYYVYAKVRTTRSFNKTVIMLSSLFGVFAMLLHAFVDYPFQVPSNVLVFLTMVAVALACARLPYRRRILP